MIRLEDISVTFFKGTPLERKALNKLSLHLKEQEFATIIGSNGAGKSTLLNALTGLIPVNEGCIEIDHMDVTRWGVEKRSRYLARVFQDPLDGSCAHLTIAENMALALNRGHVWGLKKALTGSMKEMFQEALKLLNMGLESRLDHPMGLLSGGQRQAVSLVMAVLSPLSILILDEHTAALDPKTAAMIIGQTQRLVSEKKLTTLMVTHSMHQALEVGSRTLMLHKGTIIHDFSQQDRKGLTSVDLLRLFEEMDH